MFASSRAPRRGRRLLCALALVGACGGDDIGDGSDGATSRDLASDAAQETGAGSSDASGPDATTSGDGSGGTGDHGGGSDGGQGSGGDTQGTDDPGPLGDVFEDITDELGLDAPYPSDNSQFAPTGQAWIDVDGDARLDLVLTRLTLPNLLLRGQAGGALEPVVDIGALALPEHPSGGVAPADYDNDGWTDLFIGGHYAPNVLLRNPGGGPFEDVTALAGVGDKGPATTASWGDYDGDGWLDLYVPNNNFEAPDRLYHNLQGGGFEDVSALLSEAVRLRLGLAAAFLDVDDDGDVDLYVLNDKHTGNALWRNDGPGCGGWCFTDISTESGAGVEMYAMGMAVGDYDRDGDLDLFLTNIGDHVLLQSQLSQGSLTYVDVAEDAGVRLDDMGWGEYGWGCGFLDYDADGWLDLYVAVGTHGKPSVGNRLYRNRGDGGFEDVSPQSGADLIGLSYGVATADFDDDGRPDLTVGVAVDRYHVLRNRGAHGPENHWIELELRGAGPVNRDALGARIVVTTDDGVAHRRDVISGASWGGGYPRRQHVGLGTATIEAIEITWPDGLVEQLGPTAADQRLVRDYPQP
ncbi:MAG: CRTAC1 family protein [Myxococcales bacterium]|nr:CRTAC1 family protein [Myxococcales bacterium]